MESQQGWTYDHLELILSHIQERLNKQDWIVNKFLPRVAARDTSPANQRFLHKLLEAIYERQHEKEFSNFKAMFESIIKHSGAKLRLSPHSFEPRGRSIEWNTRRPHHEFTGKPFLDFIELSCNAGASSELNRVIKESFEGLLEAKSTWILVQNQTGIITHILTPIIRMFQDGRLQPAPALGDILELLVRIVIRYDLPRWPHTRGGWAFSPRGCDACTDCAEMNHFLTSPTQLVWKFTAHGDRRNHIEHALRLDDSMSIDSKQEDRGSRCLTLTVTKKAYQPFPVLRFWKQTFKELKDAVQPLEGEWMKEFLGEQRYREIILLEGVASYTNPPSIAGITRPAPEGETQSNKRPCTVQTSAMETEPAVKQDVIVIED